MKTSITINKKNYLATQECADILKANSDNNEVISILIHLSLLSGTLVESK